MRRHNDNRKGSRDRKNRKGGPEQRSDTQRDLVPERLPAVQDQLAVPIRLRFVATPSFSGAFSVTPTNLLDAWFVAGTATNAYQLFDFVKVKKVTIRAIGSGYVAGVSAGAMPCATVGVEFMGLQAGSLAGGKQKSDSALGYNVPAFVELSPDPKSQVAQYQASTGSSIFTIRAVNQATEPLPGTIVDVDCVFRNSADVNPAAVAVARTGLTPGDLYFGGLDGNPLATTQMRSVFVRRA